MHGEGSAQDWDAYPPGSYPPPEPGRPAHGAPPAHGQPGYGPPPGYAQPGYAQPGYGPPPGYAQPGYGQPVHGGPGYGPPPGYGAMPPYGPPPGYGAMPPYGPGFAASLQWPYGPARPTAATAAAVLGHVTGGLTALVMLGILVAVLDGDDDPSTLLMLLGIPCAVAIVAGAAALLGRRTAELLFRAALASVAVLALVLVVGLATLDGDARVGMLGTVVLALPLPVLTAVFARRPVVRGWVAAG
ncbi:MAG TPA: hypothetical protein VGB58_02535 [Blastococcus sp.]